MKRFLKNKIIRSRVSCREWLRISSYKEKKKINIVLTNDKYEKLLFLNTLKCNHLPIKTTKKKKFFFLILLLARNFFSLFIYFLS